MGRAGIGVAVFSTIFLSAAILSETLLKDGQPALLAHHISLWKREGIDEFK